MPNNQVRVGNVEITSLSDGMLEFDLCNFFPSIPKDQWETHLEHLTPEHNVRFNLASFLIRSQGRNILVDTGMGPRPADTPDAPWGRLLDEFRAHGVAPEDIDAVVMTHLHRDHVGWNLLSQDGKYVPTFPRARYWMSLADWEASHNPELAQTRFPNAPASVWPLEELGLIEFMAGEYPITSELTAIPTPGHTPGHMSIMVDSQGEKALVLGDALHNPVQIEHTDWVSRADIDPQQTRLTRRSLMEQLEQQGILVAAGHLPAPGFGKIARLSGRRYWQAL